MTSSTIDVSTADGTADCYLTRPDDAAPHPGVLLFMDAIGMRPQIHRMADRIAEQGYVVLAPNVFYRAGRAPIWPTPALHDPAARAEFFATIAPLMGEISADGCRLAVRDADAYLAELGKHTDGLIGISGYCLGGRLGWASAAAYPTRVAALGGFHTGRMVTDAPDSPHLLAPQVAAEIYWGHAGVDDSMTPNNVADLNAAMDAAGLTYTTEVYQGAHHGYTMADMGAYNEQAAERHYAALFELLARTLS
ncbi:dienelactone hydrolase family protein [Gordonia asplenii]|nr:dienelactone hydrolase family protein [Gordonia asplenii]